MLNAVVITISNVTIFLWGLKAWDPASDPAPWTWSAGVFLFAQSIEILHVGGPEVRSEAALFSWRL